MAASQRRQIFMAVIRATCSECGDIDLGPGAVSARVCTDDWSADFCFTCPMCQTVSVKEADLSTVEVLAVAGVRVSEWAASCETSEAPCETSEAPCDPPISHLDIINFGEAMACESGFEAAMQALIEGSE